MEKVLVAGASGSLGFEILEQLKTKDIPVRAMVRTPESADKVRHLTADVVVADATIPEQLMGVAKDCDIVISTLGKSVSLFTERPHHFEDIDFKANANLLLESKKAQVKRFIYVSIFGAERAPGFKLTDIHRIFEELLMSAGINYTIVRPVGFFSGYLDLVILGKKNVIPVPGDGEAKTNSIHQKDLAEAIVEKLYEGPEVMDIGGPVIYTRNELAQMVKEKTGGQIVHLPDGMVKLGLLFPKFTQRDMHDKLEYFHYVTTHDMVAKKYGKITFHDFLKNVDLTKLP